MKSDVGNVMTNKNERMRRFLLEERQGIILPDKVEKRAEIWTRDGKKYYVPENDLEQEIYVVDKNQNEAYIKLKDIAKLKI